jgi:putative addiction module killer protein
LRRPSWISRQSSNRERKSASQLGGRPFEVALNGHKIRRKGRELRYHLAVDGQSPLENWFSGLDAAARAKVSVALVRLEQGNTSDTKSVGEGVLEYKISWGPGYRVYFERDGEVMVILLTGGAKQHQQRDINRAKALWRTTSCDGNPRRDDDERRQNLALTKSFKALVQKRVARRSHLRGSAAAWRH